MSLMKQKLQNEIIGRMGYVMVPTELFGCQLSDGAFKLWAYLFNQAEGWHPSYPQIEKATGISVSSCKRYIEELVTKGFLIKHRNSLGGKNTYEFTEISSWNMGTRDKIANDVKAEPNLDWGGSDWTPGGESKLNPLLEEKLRGGFENLQEGDSVPVGTPVAKPTPTATATPPLPAKGPTLDDVRLSWMRDCDVAASRTYENRQSLLDDLAMSLRANGFTLNDLSSSFKEKVTSPWWQGIKDRKKQDNAKKASLNALDQALRYLAPDDLAVYHGTPKKVPKTVKGASKDIEAEYDAWLNALDRIDDNGRPV